MYDLDRKIKTFLVISLFFTVILNPILILSLSGPFSINSISLYPINMRESPPVPITDVSDDFIYVFNNQYLDIDASQSYDPDGRIEEFIWSYGDSTYYGVHLHIKIKEKLYSIETDHLPVIPITLTVVDNDGEKGVRSIFIKVLPDKMYLSRNGLSLYPESKPCHIHPHIFNDEISIYRFPSGIEIPPCRVKLDLRIEKSFLSRVIYVGLFALDNNGKKIFIGEKRTILKSNHLEVVGTIREKKILSGFGIVVRGFSILDLKIDPNSYIEFYNS